MDSTKKNVIKELNNMLRGCEVGVAGYERYARDVAEPHLKAKFESYKAECAESAKSLAEQIAKLGGEPRYGSGMAGVISGVAYAVRGADGHDSPELLRSAHYGETMSIEQAEKALKTEGLEGESKEILNRQHRASRARQEELIGLIRDYDLS